MMSLMLGIGIAVALLFAVMAYKVRKAGKEIDRLLATNSQLEQEKQQQAVEIQQKNAEVKNAKIYKKHNESVARVSSRDVDEQLHQHGYFRDDYGLHGVRADLSESCGHRGDETSSACTQSDL